MTDLVFTPAVYPNYAVPNLTPYVHPEGDLSGLILGQQTTAPPPPIVEPVSVPPSPLPPSPLPPSSSSPPTSAPPSSSSPPTSAPPPRIIWEDPWEWTGERSRPSSRVPLPRTPAPVFEGELIRPPPPIWGIIAGGIARAGGLIGGIFWPSETGESELSAEQMREAVEAYEELARGPMPPLQRGPAERGFGDITHSMPRPAPDFPIPSPVPEIELPPVVIEAPAPVPIPSPATSSSSGSSTSSSSPPSSWPSSATFPFPDLSQLFRTSSSRSSWTLPRSSTSTPTPTTPAEIASSFVDPITAAITGALTGLGSAVLSSAPPSMGTPTQTQTAEEDRCRKKPRKKPRKCALKAPLRWAGGPNKGKLAGTKCYSFKELLE